MRLTTTRLQMPTLPPRPRWIDRAPPALLVAIAVLLIAGAISGVKTLQNVEQARAVPTPALPTAQTLIIIQKEAQPAPALATPDQQLRQELDQLRDRLAALEAERQAQPAEVAQPLQQQTTGEYPAAPILAPSQSYEVDSQAPQQPAQQAQPAPTAVPQPTAAPTQAPVISADGQSAAEQWRQEHCLTPSGPCVP